MRRTDWLLAALIASLVAIQVSESLGSAPRVPAFSFTTGGPLGLSGTVEIGQDGTPRLMAAGPCTRLLYPHTRISHQELHRLRRLATAVRFGSLPRVIRSSRMSVDLAGRSISIRAATGTVTVTESPGAFDPRFDSLYDALTEASPITLDGPCRGMRS